MKRSKKIFSRRNFLGLLGLGGVGGVGCVSYGHWLEAHWLEVGRHEVNVSKSKNREPLKILHLSDLHASPVVSLEFIKEAILLGLQQQPDLILLTGDFISDEFDQLKPYAETLSLLSAAAPTFASLGNHDGGLWAATTKRGYADTSFIREVLSQSKIKLLHNEAQALQIKSWKLTLVGLGDLWAEEIDPAAAFSQSPGQASDATLLLSHNPDSKTVVKSFTWDLMLCGHTHGGQVRFPLIGTPFLPVRDKNFVAGLYKWDGRWIHITRGVGNLHGVRFNCRPEVSLLMLV